MKIEQRLDHSDLVSGTWIADDGTKFYWSEGRSSTIVIKRPDQDAFELPACGYEDFKHEHPEIVECIDDAIYQGVEESRMMTPEEEAEHFAARN